MRTYHFIEKKEGRHAFDGVEPTPEEIISLDLTFTELDEFIQANPNLTQLIDGFPLIHSGRGLKKPDNGWRDMLKTIKKGADKGIVKSTINTM